MKNYFSTIYWWWKRKVEPGFGIKKDAKVLDLGSGDKPFWKATVLVDKLDLADDQRASFGGVKKTEESLWMRMLAIYLLIMKLLILCTVVICWSM